MFRVCRQQVKQITATAQFGYNEEFIVHAKDVVQPNNILVPSQFSQNIHFFLQLGNVLVIVPQQDTLAGKLLALASAVYVAFWFTSTCNTNLTVRSLADYQVSVQEIGGSASFGRRTRV